jgi:UDP-glucuronate decarboxylase
LLFASTSEVYGDPLVHPQPESYFGNVNPIGPIHGSGRQTRCMTYVADIIDGMLRVQQAVLPDLWPVNLGSSQEHTVFEIAEHVAAVAGVPLVVERGEPRPEDPQRRAPDLSRAFGLGWTPRTSLETGLRLTYAWWTKAQVLA